MCCGYSVFTICATYNVISHVTYVLHFALMLSKLHMCAMSNTAIFLFLYSTDFMLSWYVAKVFPKWSWDGSSCPYYYRYHFCFYIIIIIKIADNITAIPLLELCSTECSEVTIKGLNDEWATYVLENLLLMDVTSIWGGGSFNVLFPQNLTQ